MSLKLLTNLLFEPKGKHDPALTYSIKDTVMSADGSRVYFALQDVPAGIALSDEEYWKLQIDLSASKTSMDNAIADFANYAKIVGTKVRGETAKASGNPVSFLPDAGSLLQPVTVLEPQQEGSGEPSPDNIRPFIGYDKLDLNHAGKNLLRLNDVMESLFEELPDNGVWQKYQFTLAPGTYTFTAKTNTGIHRRDVFVAVLLDAADATVLQINHATLGGHAALNQSNTFTVTEAQAKRVKQIHFYYNRSNDFSRQDGERLTALQIEPGSTASDFTHYQGKLHTVQIGQTIYGIRYEWLTGKGVIEWAMETLKSADASKWTYVTDYGSVSRFNYSNNNVMPSGDVISSTFPPASIGTSDVEGIAVHGSQRQIILQIKTDRLASKDVDGLSAWLAGMPIQIVYKLATPIEIQLTPHIISAADPEQTNTLYGDGSIEVEYVKPLHVSIEERVAAIASAMLMKEE